MNVKAFSFILLVLMILSSCQNSSTTVTPTGVGDIDQIRKEIRESPTDTQNALERRASLYRWWRFLWRQGYDMRSFDSIANLLVNYTGTEPEALEAITYGYKILENLYAEGEFISELKGTPGKSDSQTDWPFYHGIDGSQRGYSPDAGPSEGALAWRFPKGVTWYASPVVENGKIYVSSPGIDVYGYCLDEKSGKILWKGRQYGIQYYSNYGSRHDPILSEERVMFRTGHRKTRMFIHKKTDGSGIPSGEKESSILADNQSDYTAWIENGRTLVVASASSGEPFWQFSPEEYFSGKPLLHQGKVVVSTNRGRVFCFERSAGEKLWEKHLNSEIRGKPVAGDGRIFLTGKKGEIFTLDPDNGSTIWRFETGPEIPGAYRYFSSPVEQNGRVYTGTAASNFYCLNASTGSILWKVEMKDWVRSAPVLLDNHIYVATLDGRLTAFEDQGNSARELWTAQVSEHGFTADLSGSKEGILASGRDLILYSLDPKNGDIQWKHGIMDGTWVNGEFVAADWSGGLQPSPVVTDGVVYIGGSDGFVNALDSESGEEIWRFETMATVSLAPAVANDKIFFSHLGGTSEHYTLDIEPAYYALERKSGAPIWQSNQFGMVWVGSTCMDNTLFFGNCDGYMFGVDALSGEKLWEYNTALNTPHEGRPLDGTFIHGFPPGVYCNPVSDADRFYSGSWSGYYYCFDREGKLIWRTQTNNGNLHGGLPDSSAPVLWKGYLYVQKLGHYLSAINKNTGIIEWEWTGVPGFLQNGTIAAHNDRVFGSVARRVTSLPYHAELYAFSDVENGGEVHWKFRGGGGLTTPVVTEDKLIFGSSTDVFLTCLDPESGEMKWRLYTGGEMMENSPALYGDKLYTHCKNGWLYAIE